MALKTFVKINSVNNLSDARYCAGMHVDLIGFNLNTVSQEQFSEITSWVSGVDFVAEVDNSSINRLPEYEVLFAESDNLELLLDCDENIKTIYRTTLDELRDVNISKIDLVLLTGEGQLSDNDLMAIKANSVHSKILIGYGINADNIENILEITGAYGIALTAGDEIRPGFKDYDELADILEVLEIDEWA